MANQHRDDQLLRQALTRQWTEVLPILSAYVTSSVRDRQHAEDIVQEVGAVVSAGFVEIPEGVSFNSWVLAVARNQILKLYRTQQRDRHIFKTEALESIAQAYERLSDSSKDMQAALERCVEQLPERSRRIIEMRYRQDKRVDGIADLLGSTSNAISGVLFRVRRLLRECIEREMSDGEAAS